jgi:peptidoglycan-N-acetylglucosamine deacetylase
MIKKVFLLLIILGFIEAKPVIAVEKHVYYGDRARADIALTFDADMTPVMINELKSGQVEFFYNQEIIQILEAGNIPATLFLTGMWAEKYPEISRQLSQNPLFEIGNHSYSHPRFTGKCSALPKMPEWGREQEIIRSQIILEKINGIKPKYFRFPGGCKTPTDVKTANKHGLIVVDWDVASGDSFNENTDAIINTVETKTKNGSIILFHLNGNKNAPKTVEALTEIIPYLKNKGYHFVTLSNLLKKSYNQANDNYQIPRTNKGD